MLSQTIGPLCVEVAGLAELPSMLSLSWLSVVLPTLCKCNEQIARECFYHLKLMSLQSPKLSRSSYAVRSLRGHIFSLKSSRGRPTSLRVSPCMLYEDFIGLGSPGMGQKGKYGLPVRPAESAVLQQ